MDTNTILFVLVAIVIVSYLFDQILEFLNLKSQRRDIPDDVAGFYDPDRYARALTYHREQTMLSFVTSAFGVVVSVVMLLAGGFGWLDIRLSAMIDNEILRALAFFGVIAFASDLLTLPFQVYSTFVLEEKFGFNRTTPATFIGDKLKGYVLGAVIGAPLLALLIFLVKSIGPDFWIWFGTAAALFVVLMNIFYTSLIVPLFNKLTPLDDGELKSAIEAFARKVDFPLDRIYVIDGSKRSSKANAFFSGIGKRKKIVLYDTLIERHTPEELVAVLAHEVGHFKKKHIVLGLFLSIIQIFFTLFILSMMIFNADLSYALGGTQWSIHLNLVAFTLLFAPISGISGLLMAMLSRKHEYEADRYAREQYSGEALGQALKRLSVDSLSNLFPHPAYVFFHYSHPPLLKRLEALKR